MDLSRFKEIEKNTNSNKELISKVFSWFPSSDKIISDALKKMSLNTTTPVQVIKGDGEDSSKDEYRFFYAFTESKFFPWDSSYKGDILFASDGYYYLLDKEASTVSKRCQYESIQLFYNEDLELSDRVEIPIIEITLTKEEVDQLREIPHEIIKKSVPWGLESEYERAFREGESGQLMEKYARSFLKGVNIIATKYSKYAGKKYEIRFLPEGNTEGYTIKSNSMLYNLAVTLRHEEGFFNKKCREMLLKALRNMPIDEEVLEEKLYKFFLENPKEEKTSIGFQIGSLGDVPFYQVTLEKPNVVFSMKELDVWCFIDRDYEKGYRCATIPGEEITSVTMPDDFWKAHIPSLHFYAHGNMHGLLDNYISHMSDEVRKVFADKIKDTGLHVLYTMAVDDYENQQIEFYVYIKNPCIEE